MLRGMNGGIHGKIKSSTNFQLGSNTRFFPVSSLGFLREVKRLDPNRRRGLPKDVLGELFNI